MTDEDTTLRFEILDGDEVVESESIDRDVVKIGKLGSSHLHIDDPSVSRIHAVIERSGDGTLDLIDLGSAEGTYVNGEKVDKSEISPGDDLRFGDVRVRFGVGGAEAEEVFGATEEGAEAETVTTEDGRQVEPYTLQGYYDDGGNYIPGYYDEHGEYHLGYGYYDDGKWNVAYGYYDPEGEWVPTDEPVQSAADATDDRGRPSDHRIYSETFLGDAGGDTLEVAHLWGDHVLDVTSFERGDSVTIGSERQADFIVGQGMVGECVPLVDCTDGTYWLVITPQMEGLVRLGDEEYTLEEAREQGLARPHSGVDGADAIELDRSGRARVEFDGQTFLVRFTDLPRGVGWLDVDTSTVPYLALSLIAHLLFLFLAMSLPGSAGDLQRDRFSAEDRFAEMMLKPEKKKPKKPGWMGKEEKAAKHKGEETKAGKEESKNKDKKMAMKGPSENENPKLKKKRNKKIAMNAGLNKMFAKDQVASNWGSSNKTVGSDAIHALGNLDGESKGSSKGFGGLGLQGAGRGGGGGMSERGVGIGNVGTAGRGGGGSKNYGEGKGNLGKKETKTPEVVPGKLAAEGALSKEIIRKVVRQHRREIKYCYEKELQKNPSLKGQVDVQFTISPTGDVIAAVVKKSTLNNATVEQCLQGKIRRWVFPNPEGGGVVKVNYPFNFSAQ
ncbi:MAG: AgmX/PglI C-terminal domain-containing protein [Bradymonadaceae bacterium]